MNKNQNKPNIKTPTLRATLRESFQLTTTLREISLGIASAIALLTASPVAAQVGITSLTTNYETRPTINYDTKVGVPCNTGDYPGGCNSDINLEFGVGATNDLKISAFQYQGNNYSLTLIADKLVFRRVDNDFTTGDRQLIFFESNSNTQMRSSYTNTMEEALLGTIINKGIDNAFSNDNSFASNNIERIDYILTAGLSIPVGTAVDIGFMILERGGNDPFNIAPITALDASGNPSQFGQLKTVPASTWGNTTLNINSAVMRREESEPQFRSSHLVGSQAISSIYVSIASLTDFPGQKIYGYAIFPNDIDSSNDLLNLTDFPTNSSGESGEGGLDLMTGGAIFMRDTLSTVSGTLYQDENEDDILNNGEPTLPANVTLQLIDASNNVIASANTDANGEYSFLGIANGNYTIKVDTNDPNIPTGQILGTANNLPINVSGNITGQNFGFNQAIANNPNIILVKRITAINSISYTDLIDGVDDINSPNYVPAPYDADDNHPNWPANYLQGRLNGGNIVPGDELEYTIYFLSTGDTTALNVLMCDRLPQNTTFIPTAFNSIAPGADKGILLSYDSNSLALTGIQDTDNGQYFPIGIEATDVYPNINCGGSNTNGAIVVNLGNVPNSTISGDPTNSYGFIRFRVRVN
ncbi:SdrD B-like domain-containing protein [Nodularia sphaerocarpa]|uniref:SdrD B-like domain-containing protein n=1 Tax=Nodularia sphaerocarpa TaxID=137816 RepID=UPI001EFB4E5B|nr:SdrD B-like domain-containing protein [Nodularia sphaerocarpa]MDB9376137.1 SdrD B-like domain-containing protein [Nodularia sphaerocarpa CS-585]MDB9377846.1 SdrD B-like domain-containing protein [Nodularia sphaerocarpa CS-585A2]ULP73429.1 hypothetical protein BDGGKGIB_03083 [Nodularia sphaerocarpa UHCC 0038]